MTKEVTKKKNYVAFAIKVHLHQTTRSAIATSSANAHKTLISNYPSLCSIAPKGLLMPNIRGKVKILPSVNGDDIKFTSKISLRTVFRKPPFLLHVNEP